MKKFLSGAKGSTSDRAYAPPPGPPPQQYPQQDRYGVAPGGAAQQYYGSQAPAQPYVPSASSPPYASHGGGPTQYAPPAAPPPASAGTRPTGQEDQFAALRKYDTVILVDDSGSMEMFWDETRDALQGVVQTSIQYDEDGIDLYFFNEPTVSRNVNSTAEVSRIFRRIDPRRSTPTAAAMSRILEPYLRALEASKASGGPKPKPMNLIVLTDGAPDRGQDPEPVLVDCGKRLDTMKMPLFQLGVNFIQIGSDDEASVHLASLDDDLKNKHRVRDYVDTTPYQASNGGRVTSQFILKALLGGINRRVDREPMK